MVSKSSLFKIEYIINIRTQCPKTIYIYILSQIFTFSLGKRVHYQCYQCHQCYYTVNWKSARSTSGYWQISCGRTQGQTSVDISIRERNLSIRDNQALPTPMGPSQFFHLQELHCLLFSQVISSSSLFSLFSEVIAKFPPALLSHK